MNELFKKKKSILDLRRPLVSLLVGIIVTGILIALCGCVTINISDDASSGTESEVESGTGDDMMPAAESDSDDDNDESNDYIARDEGEPAISEDEVIQIVLERVPGAAEEDIVSFELDYDDGRWIYDGEMLHEGLEYEFEIDAQNGNILDWEIDD